MKNHFSKKKKRKVLCLQDAQIELIKKPNIICYNYLKFQTIFVEKVTVSTSMKHVQINKHRNLINLRTNNRK
jgi:hypothetical protein